VLSGTPEKFRRVTTIVDRWPSYANGAMDTRNQSLMNTGENLKGDGPSSVMAELRRVQATHGTDTGRHPQNVC